MKAAPTVQPLLTFGQCLKNILGARKLSASALSRMMEQKSRNSMFRILDDTGGPAVQAAFFESLKASDCLHLTEQEERELEEIVRLVGIDALSYKDRLTLEATRSIREDYLHQNAFHEVDTYTSPAKQAMLLRLIIGYYEKSLDALSKDASFNKLAALPVREDIGRFKYTEEDKCAERYEEITAKLNAEIRELTEGGEA